MDRQCLPKGFGIDQHHGTKGREPEPPLGRVEEGRALQDLSLSGRTMRGGSERVGPCSGARYSFRKDTRARRAERGLMPLIILPATEGAACKRAETRISASASCRDRAPGSRRGPTDGSARTGRAVLSRRGEDEGGRDTTSRAETPGSKNRPGVFTTAPAATSFRGFACRRATACAPTSERRRLGVGTSPPAAACFLALRR